MIFDHRTYTLRPGTALKALDVYETYGYAPQVRHLGPPVLYAWSESGGLNALVHVWAYADAADREARRAAMSADPDWREFRRQDMKGDFRVHQENRLLIAAPFFTPKR
jgi:hypothetical protein